MLEPHLQARKVGLDLRDQLTIDGLIGAPQYQIILSELLYLEEGLRKESKLDMPNVLPHNIIEEYGLASYVIQFYQTGLSVAQISNSLSILASTTISEEDINDWLSKYKETNSLFVKPAQNKVGSVFDASSRYQDLYEMLSETLDDLRNIVREQFSKQGPSKEQVIVDLLREMRMLTSDADKFARTQMNAQSFRHLIQDIVNAISSYNPIVAKDIITILRHKSSIWDAVLLGGISQPALHKAGQEVLSISADEIKMLKDAKKLSANNSNEEDVGEN